MYSIRRNIFLLVVSVEFILLLLAPPPSIAGEATVSDYLITNTPEQVLVYFRVKNCFSKAMEDAILAGITTTFLFTIELYSQRSFWFDKKESVLEIKHSVKYDNVKRTLYVTYTESGKKPEQFKELRKAEIAMSDLSGIPIIAVTRLIRDKQYYVRVRAELVKIRLPLDLKNTFLFSSLWNFKTDWFRQDFIY